MRRIVLILSPPGAAREIPAALRNAAHQPETAMLLVLALLQSPHAGVLPGQAAVYAPPPDSASALEGALPRLDRLQPAAKELLLAGMVLAIAADAAVSVSEAELLRTVCAVLHCPLPPILEELHAAG